ncbi:Ferric iron ABC transporter, iron-binding protein [Olavius sp. associated proteobacterium Delta 1]|nr:Ferric iron ABC transporter, iron-binding protein [Olavius sp. associated proteobacterium Delta 1]
MRLLEQMKKIITCCIGFCALFIWVTHSQAAPEVIVYTALDQIFSEPILQEFEKTTGIKVKAVYDLEATKTTGLVNRLIAEKAHPQCDVFWNNEVIKSIILKQKGVLAVYHSPSAQEIPAIFKDKQGYWTGFAARARVLVVNTDRLSTSTQPQSIRDLTRPAFKGKAAIANPLFGTTATHVAALFSYWGEAEAKQFFRDLKANQIRILDGNSVVKDRTGSGAILAGFTDTDDVNVGIQAGMPIQPVFPDKEGIGTLLIPNTVALIQNSPHPVEAKRLIDYLLSKEVERKLAFCPSVQMPLRKDVPTPTNFVTIDQIKAMPVDYEKVAEVMDASVRFVQEAFLR